VKAQGEVPAVVVGGSLNALGVVRSLTSGSVPTLLLETTQRCPTRWSRHCRFVRVPSVEGRPLIEALGALSARLDERAVLIMTDDRAVEAVSSFREELEAGYHFKLPPKSMVPLLADKASFQLLAESEGLPVPRSAILRDSTEVSLLERLTPPLVIKPASKALVLNSDIERAVRVETLEQARAVVAERVLRAGGLIVQEWIDGPDTEIYFVLFVCDAESRMTAHFKGRKVVCEPPRVGSTALCTEAEDPTGELVRLTQRYLSTVGYVGIGGLEFKRDQRSGRFIIVEPTVGRTDWQAEIATLCGVNLPLAAYRTALGQPVEPAARAQSPVAWRSSRSYEAPPGELRPGTRLVDGYYRPSDPLPGLYYYGFERFAVRLWNLVSQPGRWYERATRLGGNT
jgi:D-aspartate ligase